MQVALVQRRVADAHACAAARSILQLAGAGHGGHAHAARDERRVRGLAALAGEDALRRVEAGDVVGLGERAHEDHVAPVGRRRDRLGGGEDDRALGGARRRRHAARRAPRKLGAAGRRSGAAARRASRRRSSRSASSRVEQPLADGVDREAHRGLRGALGVARLEHVEAPLLDGELRVLHVLVVALERAQDLHQLRVDLGHATRAARAMSRGVAHAADDVLALGVGQEVADWARARR